MVRVITAATTLTLALSSVAAAQTGEDTRFPDSMGPTLVGAVVANALDDADTNALIERTARDYHQAKLGGKISEPATPKKNSTREPVRGGWIPMQMVEGTAELTQAVLDLVGEADPDYVILSGGDWKASTGIARSNPGTTVLDINAPLACLTETGQPDLTGECLGGEEIVPNNYGAIEFALEEGAYVAGVVAARESRGQPLGIISGAIDCLECDRYITGFINGARSVEPEVDIELAYLADDELAGFSDEASAKTYAETFIDVYQPGILMPVARGATMGMIEAACEAGIKVIGAGIDVSAERPDFRQSCVMASIVPDVARAVEEAMYYFSRSTNQPVITYDLAGGGLTMTDEWRVSPTKRVDTNDFYDAARLAVETDQVEPCPDGCGVFLAEPEAEEATDG